MRCKPADAGGLLPPWRSKTFRVPSRLTRALSSRDPMMMKARWTTTSAVGDQRIHGIAVQDVAPQVFRLGPPVRGRIELTPRHPDDSLDSWLLVPAP